jgi:hypothetical protein
VIIGRTKGGKYVPNEEARVETPDDWMVPDEVAASGDECVLTFVALVEDGETLQMAECLALRCFPRIRTNDVIIGSMPTISQMMDRDPVFTTRLCKIAEKRGYKPKAFDVYNHAIADSEGDPLAFCGHDIKGQITDVQRARGKDALGGMFEGNDQRNYREPEKDPFENASSRGHQGRESGIVHRLHPRIANRISLGS